MIQKNVKTEIHMLLPYQPMVRYHLGIDFQQTAFSSCFHLTNFFERNIRFGQAVTAVCFVNNNRQHQQTAVNITQNQWAHFRPWLAHFMSIPHENLTYKLSDRDLACVKISLNSDEKKRNGGQKSFAHSFVRRWLILYSILLKI